jgi:hypothetical protein
MNSNLDETQNLSKPLVQRGNELGNDSALADIDYRLFRYCESS